MAGGASIGGGGGTASRSFPIQGLVPLRSNRPSVRDSDIQLSELQFHAKKTSPDLPHGGPSM